MPVRIWDYPNTRRLRLLHVFLFFNKLEYKDENEDEDGFNSLLINVCSPQPDSHYSNIKTSVLVNFGDINYLQCGNIFVDDTSFIKKMTNLKEISVGQYDEEIIKIAKEAGIKCN